MYVTVFGHFFPLSYVALSTLKYFLFVGEQCRKYKVSVPTFFNLNAEESGLR